ncbi:MAG: UbiA family prenyltransferase [Hyphomicrobium sp.]
MTSPVPLIVDLDGTLIQSDLLVESAFSALAAEPLALLDLLAALPHGRAALKEQAANRAQIDVTTLPYDDAVLSLIRKARDAGRPVYLASASHEKLVEQVARHLGLFDGWFGSSGLINLKSEKKAERLVEQFGDKGFDYLGNDAADLEVWRRARRAIAVRTPESVREKLAVSHPEAEFIASPATGWRPWLKLLRVHQYAKNLLVFVPLVAAHAFATGQIVSAVLAFVAFSLCASGVYILNDLIDLGADRAHPSKKNRPLAAGTVPILQALVAAPALIVTAFVIAAATSGMFAAMLAIYFGLTLAYSFWLKRKMLLDAVALAGLYTLRVIGGATAIAVPVSRWLLAFSLFIFMSLALVKRYVELAKLLDRGLPNPTNRAYEKGDLPVIASLAAAAGYNAVIVLALYVSSDAMTGLYRRPEFLWLVCPIVMYWVSRLLLKAHRRQIDDDPVVFALKDRVSLAVALSIGVLGVLAI